VVLSLEIRSYCLHVADSLPHNFAFGFHLIQGCSSVLRTICSTVEVFTIPGCASSTSVMPLSFIADSSSSLRTIRAIVLENLSQKDGYLAQTTEAPLGVFTYFALDVPRLPDRRQVSIDTVVRCQLRSRLALVLSGYRHRERCPHRHIPLASLEPRGTACEFPKASTSGFVPCRLGVSHYSAGLFLR